MIPSWDGITCRVLFSIIFKIFPLKAKLWLKICWLMQLQWRRNIFWWTKCCWGATYVRQGSALACPSLAMLLYMHVLDCIDATAIHRHAVFFMSSLSLWNKSHLLIILSKLLQGDSSYTYIYFCQASNISCPLSNSSSVAPLLKGSNFSCGPCNVLNYLAWSVLLT